MNEEEVENTDLYNWFQMVEQVKDVLCSKWKGIWKPSRLKTGVEHRLPSEYVHVVEFLRSHVLCVCVYHGMSSWL